MMGGRYYLTGVQMGLLMALDDNHGKIDMLMEIMNNQFIGNYDKKEWDKVYNKLCKSFIKTEEGNQ